MENTHSEIESLWHGAQHWRFSVRRKGRLVGDLVPYSWAVSFVPTPNLASTGHCGQGFYCFVVGLLVVINSKQFL